MIDIIIIIGCMVLFPVGIVVLLDLLTNNDQWL